MPPLIEVKTPKLTTMSENQINYTNLARLTSYTTVT
jgi:hypothetical protein